MSKMKRKGYSAEFKAKVALETIKGEQTLAELATRFSLRPNIITNWKRQAINNMANAFDSRSEKKNSINDAQL